MSARWGQPAEDRTGALLDEAGAPLLWALAAYVVLIGVLLSAVLL